MNTQIYVLNIWRAGTQHCWRALRALMRAQNVCVCVCAHAHALTFVISIQLSARFEYLNSRWRQNAYSTRTHARTRMHLIMHIANGGGGGGGGSGACAMRYRVIYASNVCVTFLSLCALAWPQLCVGLCLRVCAMSGPVAFVRWRDVVGQTHTVAHKSTEVERFRNMCVCVCACMRGI